MTAITVQGVAKTYPGQRQPALADLSMEIDSGRLTALLGPSGCGKTTLLKMVAGLLDPSAGDILFDGASILALPPEKRSVVMVYQNYLLFPHLNVADNVGFGLKMRGVAKGEIAARVAETLAQVKLVGVESRRPSDLSGGQQQRVALARALVVRPKVLLLDEPLSNLDAHLRLEMRELIRNLQRETQVTCVFVTHDQEEAVALADKVALILEGRLRQYGAPAQMYERPATATVARFFGSVNFLPGTCDGQVFKCALGAFRQNGGPASGACTATVRPENIAVCSANDSGALPGTVDSVAYLGTSCRLQVSLRDGGSQLAVATAADAFRRYAAGDPIWLRVPEDKVWIVSAEE